MTQETRHIPFSLSESAFELLFRSHFREMCLLSVRYVKDMEVSREIVQDAFTSLWEKRTSIDPLKPVKAYLATTVRNKSLNYLRDNKKFNGNLLGFEKLYPEETAEVSDPLVAEEIRKKIRSATDLLPEKCREIFLMNRNEQLKYHEIAGKLGISVKTVETQMSKALRHMRDHLKEFLTLAVLVLQNFFHHPSG
jgi:RNA polymerase sigma-70 factor (ECF subfamily)